MGFWDWSVVGLYVAIAIGVGVLFSRRAGRGLTEYFLSGRSLPWWVVGSSMVATTFAADTPLAITEFIREPGGGIWANWAWWCQAIVHVLAAVAFSRLWRRARVLTDNELIELRYGGKKAAFLRAFKALYFSTVFNIIVMAWVTKAMSGVLSQFLDIPMEWAVVACLVVALVYSVLGGFWGVVITDLIQFVVAMVGSVVFAILAAQHVGGLDALIAQVDVGARLAFFPTQDAPPEVWYAFWVYVLMLWWSFHGTDGGGYIIQRMMSAKNERHALLGTSWFALAHYVLRIWPWAVVALASLVVFPQVTDHKLAYPMLLNEILPAGLKGVCVAMFLAAFMSTIDTHLNWGSSYIVNDLYKRFIRPDASERHFVVVSRLTMLGLAVVTGLVAFFLIDSISGAWLFLWAMGSGIGLVLILRWFWWRINAWSEIAALSTSLIGATGLYVYEWLAETEVPYYIKLPAVVLASIAVWVPVTLITGPERREVIERFCERVRPSGMWPAYARKSSLGRSVLLAWLGGIGAIYGCLFSIGHLLMGSTDGLFVSLAVAVVGATLAWMGTRERRPAQ